MNAATTSERPLLTPAITRRMLGWSQARVAVAADVGIGSVRIYELDPEEGVVDPRKRRALAATYASMRRLLLRPPPPRRV